MWEFLKLYPNKTGFFVGIAIGLCTYIISTSLCVFASGCSNGNPFFPLATFLGSCLVGMYCSWLIKGKFKFLVGFIVTLLTLFAALWSGIREIFDNSLGGESFLSQHGSPKGYRFAYGICSLAESISSRHSVLYGFITLIFAFAISLLNKSQASE